MTVDGQGALQWVLEGLNGSVASPPMLHLSGKFTSCGVQNLRANLQDMLKYAMVYHQGPHQKGQILAVAAHLGTIRATCNPRNTQVFKLVE